MTRPLALAIVALVAALLCTGVGGCERSASTPASPTPSATLRTYSNPQFGFSIRYDPSLLEERIDASTSGNGTVAVDFLVHGTRFMVPPPAGASLLGLTAQGLSVWAQRRASAPAWLSSLAAMRRWWRKNTPKTVAVTVSRCTIGGLAGKRVTFTWGSTSAQLGGHASYGYVRRGDVTYSVADCADEAVWAKSGGAMHQAIGSLKFAP